MAYVKGTDAVGGGSNVNQKWVNQVTEQKRKQQEEAWAAAKEEERRQERVASQKSSPAPNPVNTTQNTTPNNPVNTKDSATDANAQKQEQLAAKRKNNPVNTNVGQSAGYQSSSGTVAKAEAPAPTASNSNPKLTQTPSQTPATTYTQPDSANDAEAQRQEQLRQKKLEQERQRQAELARQQEIARQEQLKRERELAMEQLRQQELARQEELARQQRMKRERELAMAQLRQEEEERQKQADNPVNSTPQSQEEWLQTPEGQQALANQQAQQANDMALREAAMRNDPFANFRVGEPEEQRYDARYPRTTTPASQTTVTTNPLQEWVNREYPEYTGDQSPAFVERNWYRGRELMQPQITVSEQTSNARKLGNVLAGAQAEDETEFYTGENDYIDDVPLIQNTENHKYSNADINNAIEYMRRELGVIGLSPDEEIEYAKILLDNGTNPMNVKEGNPIRRITDKLIDLAQKITRPNSQNSNAFFDTLAGLYNLSESDGWLTQEASDLYGQLQRIDPEAPGAEILEEARRQELLDKMTAEDEALNVQHPNITGEEIKDAMEQSQLNARNTTNQLISTAREITQPVANAVSDWANSGSAYSDLQAQAAQAAQDANLIPGTAAYERYMDNYINQNMPAMDKEIENPFGVTESTSTGGGNPQTSGVNNAINGNRVTDLVNDARDAVLQEYLARTGLSMAQIGDYQHQKELAGLYNDATQNVYNTIAPYYANEFANGDARNIPAELMASVYESVTGDTTYANEMAREYERFKGMGMNDRQISAELYRRAAEHNNPLARATDAQGNLHFDLALAGSGLLPEEIAVPKVNADGTGNEAYNEFVNSVNYFDDSGMSLYKGADGNYYTGVAQPDGTSKPKKYTGDVTAIPKYSFSDILSTYVNPKAGQPGESTWRGLEGLYDGLSEGERKGMDELLARFVRGGDMGSEGEDRGNLFKTEFADMTQEEYDRLVNKFLNQMPAISGLINNNVVSQDEVENFFFKNIDDGTGTGTGTRPGSSTTSTYGKTTYFKPSYEQDMDYGVKLPYGKYTEADLIAAGNKPYTDKNGKTQYEGYYYWDGYWYPVDQEKAAYYKSHGNSYKGWEEPMREYYRTFGTYYGYRPDWKTAGGKNIWKNNQPQRSYGGNRYNYSGNSGGNSSNYSRSGGGWSYGGGNNYVQNYYNGNGQGYSYSSNGSTEQSPVNPSAKNQKQNRIYNIMKNWSF